MKVLGVGAGGRGPALTWAIAASPLCAALYCAPGNAGIAREARCVAIGAQDLDGLVRFAKDEAIDLVVVGPEAPLVAGLVDRLGEAGVKAVGPTPNAALVHGHVRTTRPSGHTGAPITPYGRYRPPDEVNPTASRCSHEMGYKGARLIIDPGTIK